MKPLRAWMAFNGSIPILATVGYTKREAILALEQLWGMPLGRCKQQFKPLLFRKCWISWEQP